MPFCCRCGQEAGEEAMFCTNCGNGLRPGVSSAAKQLPENGHGGNVVGSVSGSDMDENPLPFILRQGEQLLLDAPSIHYHGVGVENIGFFGGGASGALFGGVAYSEQKKREKSIWDAQFCHAYLTNLRAVFVKAKTSLFSSGNRETKLENVISDVDIQTVQGIVSGKKWWDPTVELAVKLPDGSVNNIAFAFLRISSEGSASGGHPRLPERDEWVRMIHQCVENPLKSPASVGDEEDPLRVLKLRYAKGEITKEQYEDMRRDLA